MWRELAALTDMAVVEEMMTAIALSDVIEAAGRLLVGEVRGRLIVDCGG